MTRWLKISLKILTGSLLLVALLWFSLVAYVYSHKKKVLEIIAAQLNGNINGKISVKSMSPEMIRGFPGVSIALKNVLLTDSLYARHRHPLLHAETIFLSVNVFSVLRGKPDIKRIEVYNGKVYLFTDKSGYSNTHIFKKRKDETLRKQSAILRNFSFEKVQLTIENQPKLKLFNIEFEKLNGKIIYQAKGWEGSFKTTAKIHRFTFNTSKGSFLKNKTIRARLFLNYDEEKELLSVPEQRIYIDRDRIFLSAKFDLSRAPVAFFLKLKAPAIQFSHAGKMLSENIASKLNMLDLKKPVNLNAEITGRIKFRDTPLVRVHWIVEDNDFITPVGTIQNARFTGNFLNEKRKGMGHGDENSMITLNELSGNWQQIPFRVDTLTISNLKSPLLEGRFLADFPLERLNQIVGGNSFAFNAGQGHLNLVYKGGISKNDTNKAYVFGKVQVYNGILKYLPRNLEFKKLKASLDFQGRDLNFTGIYAEVNRSDFRMNGSMKNFLSLYYTAPSKMKLDWNIKSKKIELEDFTGFLGVRKSGMPAESSGKAKRDNTVARISSQLDKVMAEASIHLNTDVEHISYRNFAASDVKAEIGLASEKIFLQKISFRQSGGTISIRGSVRQKDSKNDFHLKADIDEAEVQKLFSAFDNFNQDAITDKNIRGILSAAADVSGSVSETGKILPYSLNGDLKFNLKNGALVHFEPIQSIGKLIFRNRNVESIRLNQLEGKMVLKGDKVLIPPMLIETSVLNLKVDGVYGFKGGTDINIDVPLRNPEKDKDILNDSLRAEKALRGMVLRFKAVDGDGKNVKIKWVLKKKSPEMKRKAK